MEHNGEKDYLYAYKVGFKNGATADIVHYERIRLKDFVKSSDNPGEGMDLLKEWGISL